MGYRAVSREKSLGHLQPALAAEWDDEVDCYTISAQSAYVANWKCAAGHTWSAKIQYRTLTGNPCPQCPKNRTKTYLRDTHPELVAQLQDASNASLTTYSNKAVGWECERGHRWEATIVGRTTLQIGCPVCANRVVLPGYNDLASQHPAIAAEMRSLDAASVVSGSNTVSDWECEHGHQYQARIVDRTRNGHGCPTCGGKRVLAGFNDLATVHPDLAEEWDDEGKSPTEVTRGSAYRARWKCRKAGHQWYASVADRACKKNGCPECAAKTFVSAAENDIAGHLRSLGLNVETTVRRFPNIHELDIFLPDLNVAVEYNGLYWHSEEKGRDRDYHKNKHDACAAQGIRLIQVWEDDWRDRRRVVERMLAHKLGVSSEAKVYARATTIVDMPLADSQTFFEENHIQSWTSGTHYLGLRTADGTIVAAMILKASGRGRELRLERYATSCHVIGGQSKLIRYAERNIPGWDSMVTFADLEVSDGNLYEKTGWTHDGVIRTDYRYVYKGRRLHKFGFRLARFERDPDLIWEEGLTERELAAKNGILRVWDSGKIRYRRQKSA